MRTVHREPDASWRENPRRSVAHARIRAVVRRRAL